MLGQFAYTRNDAVLHTDSRFLPRTAAARASWNYRLGDDGRPTITYHLNRLQALDAERDYCLTLNEAIPEEHVLGRFSYEHPLYTVATLRAQSRAAAPRRRTTRTSPARYFGNGFHEDGLASRGRRRPCARSRLVRSAIYTGTLVHARRSPARHVFRYPVSYWLFDLDELAQLERRLRLFSVNRPNVVSLRDVDHFDGAAPLKEAVIDFAADPSIERVLMLTQPRVLGYVFNPVSFYWCYRADGSLACMVSELNNTFGERLPEVLRGPELRYEHAQAAARLAVLRARPDLRVRVLPAGRRGLGAHPRPRPGRRPAADGGAARAPPRAHEPIPRRRSCCATRCMPLQVIALIHWQALRLWLKRVPFHHKPPFVPGEGSVRR